MSRPEEKQDVGLVGGSIDARVDNARVPPLDAAHVLAPFRRPADRPEFEDFVRQGNLHLEVGFGRPHHLCDLAAAKPDAQVLGFEIRRRWVQQASTRATRDGLTNVRAVEGDARPYIERLIPSGGLAAAYVLFPDPWWKKKHHKRRVFQPGFIATLADRLKPGGIVVAKTDVEAYADLIDELFFDSADFTLAGTNYADPVLGTLPRSHREKKCVELGIPVYQFRFVREASP